MSEISSEKEGEVSFEKVQGKFLTKFEKSFQSKVFSERISRKTENSSKERCLDNITSLGRWIDSIHSC